MPLSLKIREYVVQNIITREQAMGLSNTSRLNLESRPIRDLVTDGTITIDQAIGLSNTAREALVNEETRQRLRNGTLTIQNIMGGQIPGGSGGNINDSQSTHTASVHRTVSGLQPGFSTDILT